MKHESSFVYSPLVLIFLMALAFSGCATAGIEKPEYEVELKDGDFEVRSYAEQVVAETIVKGTLEEAGNRAFRPLFRYISGANRSKTEIPMTSPVGQEQPDGEKIAMTAPVGTEPAQETAEEKNAGSTSDTEWAVTFMMPAHYTLETLPEPLDDNVRLRVVPAHRAAVVRYSGTWSKSGYEEHLERLRKWMEQHSLKAGGNPVWARYNPPFTPWFMRRNEILIPVTETH